MRPGSGLRLAPFAVACGFFAGMAALALSPARPFYFAVIRAWGIDPWPTPFLDTDTVLSALVCLRRGVDVYAANPCDTLARVYDYSPLWLVLARLPVTPAWLVPAGLAVDFGFLLSLLLLPGARRWTGAAVLAAAAVSPPVLFAAERGNNDLVLFALAASAAVLACRSGGLRALGYGAALLAGLLKYYPMTLLALTLRERPARFVGVLAAAALLVALFVAVMGHDLARALHLIPTGGWFGSMFGAATLPGGLGERTDLAPGTVTALRLVLPLGAFAGGGVLAARPRFRESIAGLSVHEGTALLAGAMLVLGCFFTAQNISYRMVHLLLVLPALTALPGSRLGRATAVAVLGLLWSDAWRGGPDLRGGVIHHQRLADAGWLLREGLWWWVVVVLIACAAALLRQTATVRWLLVRFGTAPNRHPPAARLSGGHV